MTLREESRLRKEEVRERIRATWHIANAQKEIEYCERMLGRYTKRAEDLRYKVTYYQSIGLPCAGLEQQLVKAEDDLFKHEQRISRAELELNVWQHRADHIDLF